MESCNPEGMRRKSWKPAENSGYRNPPLGWFNLVQVSPGQGIGSRLSETRREGAGPRGQPECQVLSARTECCPDLEVVLASWGSPLAPTSTNISALPRGFPTAKTGQAESRVWGPFLS